VTGVKTDGSARTRFTACPACDARLVLFRSHPAPIDSCGFESYNLECKQCGTALVGIIDPYDDALLVAKLEH
jgi:hypothetical protein